MPLCLQLYSHHVLARLASDAEEVAGAGAQRTRTLPSFWAAKAALERQRQRGPRRPKGGGGGEQADEEEEGEGQLRRKRARTAADGGEEAVAEGMEVDQSGAEEESLSSFRWATRQAGGSGFHVRRITTPVRLLFWGWLKWPAATHRNRTLDPPGTRPRSELDRHAATLAQLADESGAQLTPRSCAAYGRIGREFDVLIARVGCPFHLHLVLMAAQVVQCRNDVLMARVSGVLSACCTCGFAIGSLV